MKKYTKIITSMLLAALASPSYASTADAAYANQFTQEIHVVNLLANADLPDPGMTPTAIVVDYYNGGNRPCWTSNLAYRESTTIHAGPTQGCKAKVTRVVISPTLTADKIKTYLAPIYVQVDPNKYTNQILVVQETPPTFDTQTGLAAVSGTATTKTQSQFQ